MKMLIPIFLFTIFLFGTTDAKSQNNDKSKIEKLILKYQKALNPSDVNSIVSLYSQDAALMPYAGPTAEGIVQVKQTYEYVFKKYSFTLKFTVLEVVINENYAFVRSVSQGAFFEKTSGQTLEDENRELFVFEKQNDNWKIARYI